MKEFATENELLDINRVEASTARQYDEWDDAALAVILYCPGRDVEPPGYLFPGEKRGGHRYNSSIETPINCDTRNAVLAPNVRNPRSTSET